MQEDDTVTCNLIPVRKCMKNKTYDIMTTGPHLYQFRSKINLHSQHPAPPVSSSLPPHLVLEVRADCQQFAHQETDRHYLSVQLHL
jgi:hypothetical protein